MTQWRTAQHGVQTHIRGHLLQDYYQSETHGFMETRIDLGNEQRRHAFVIFEAPEGVSTSQGIRDLFRRDPERAAEVFPRELEEGVNYVSHLANMDYYAFVNRVPENIRNAMDNGSNVQEAIKLGTLAEFGISGDVAKTFSDNMDYTDMVDHLLTSMPDGPPRTNGGVGSDYERSTPAGRIKVTITHWDGVAVQAPMIDSKRAVHLLAGSTGIDVGAIPDNVRDPCVIKPMENAMA